MFVALFSVYFFLVSVLKEANALCSMSVPLNLKIFLMHCNVFQQRGKKRQNGQEDMVAALEAQVMALWNQLEERDSSKQIAEAAVREEIQDLRKRLQDKDSQWVDVEADLQDEIWDSRRNFEKKPVRIRKSKLPSGMKLRT
jgi:molybdopterin converting factor small subunit